MHPSDAFSFQPSYTNLEQIGGYDVLCRKDDGNCDNAYAKKPMSYEVTMLTSDFKRFGLALETLIKQHNDQASIKGIMEKLANTLRGKYRLISTAFKNMGDQFGWEEILYLVSDQFAVIGRKLGPREI